MEGWTRTRGPIVYPYYKAKKDLKRATEDLVATGPHELLI